MPKKPSSDIKDAWLDIDVDEQSLFKPMDILSTDDDDDFYLRLAWLLTNPEYFSFLCKQIFNIDLLPSQALMLNEMWSRKFPFFLC